LSIISQKYGFGIRDPGSEIRDPGSGKNLFRIPDPGVKKAPIPDPGSATLHTKIEKGQKFHVLKYWIFSFEG
jgi:hypothetical protein